MVYFLPFRCVAVSDDVVSDLIMAEAEQVETTVTEEQSEDSSNVETSNTEEPTAEMPVTEADAVLSTTEALSEPKRFQLSLPHHLWKNSQPHRSRHHRLHLRRFLQGKLPRHLLQMTEEILLTEVRCSRLPSTYRRQNMFDMMQTVWQGLL